MGRQSRPTTTLLAALLLASLSVEMAGAANDPGSAGFLSMRLGVGSRYAGMGETGVAEAADASAVWWNPANLAYADGTQVTLQHLEHFDLFRKESLVLSHATKHGGLGLMFSGFYSDNLPRYTIANVGVPQGDFRPYDLVVGLAYGHRFKDLSLGVTAKFIYQRIDVYEGSSLAFDLGITHRTQLPGLTLAAVVQNLGDKMVLNQEAFDIPRTFRIGAGYTPHSESGSWAENLTASLEMVVPNDSQGRVHTGLEARIHKLFALRGGYRFNYDTYGWTAGAGFRKGGLAIDYSYLSNENDFAANHVFSLSLAFND